jgi:molecular chaperone GrpE
MVDKPVTDPADTSPADDPRATTAVDASPDAGESLVSTDPIADLQRERDDYYDRWMRKAAEFENYRRRIERERREQADHTVVRLLEDLLLVVDDFDRALTVDAGKAGAAYKKGIELIHAKLHELLRKQGVRPIEALGADFDPNLHQAVLQEPSEGHRDGEVIGELQKGYMMGDRLLRPAMVKVAKAS